MTQIPSLDRLSFPGLLERWNNQARTRPAARCPISADKPQTCFLLQLIAGLHSSFAGWLTVTVSDLETFFDIIPFPVLTTRLLARLPMSRSRSRSRSRDSAPCRRGRRDRTRYSRNHHRPVSRRHSRSVSRVRGSRHDDGTRNYRDRSRSHSRSRGCRNAGAHDSRDYREDNRNSQRDKSRPSHPRARRTYDEPRPYPDYYRPETRSTRSVARGMRLDNGLREQTPRHDQDNGIHEQSPGRYFAGQFRGTGMKLGRVWVRPMGDVEFREAGLTRIIFVEFPIDRQHVHQGLRGAERDGGISTDAVVSQRLNLPSPLTVSEDKSETSGTLDMEWETIPWGVPESVCSSELSNY